MIYVCCYLGSTYNMLLIEATNMVDCLFVRGLEYLFAPDYLYPLVIRPGEPDTIFISSIKA